MKNLIDYHERLTAWRNERHLSVKDQQGGYLRNVMEELGELAEAIKNNDDDGKIDALCDILVFSLNCLDTKPYKSSSVIYLGSKETALKENLFYIYKFINAGFDTAQINNLYTNLSHLAELYGYNLDKAMDETIKEISSRSGEYDHELKKFVKDDGAYDEQHIRENYSSGDDIEIIDKGDYFLIKQDGEILNELVKWYKADYKKALLCQP